jgi:hypothetical protein
MASLIQTIFDFTMLKKTSILILCITVAVALAWFYFSEKHRHKVRFAHYWWNSHFNPDTLQMKRIGNNGLLYLHVFDIDAQPGSEPKPMAELREFNYRPGMQIVPVVYITQRTFKAMKPENDSMLAGNIMRYCEQILRTKRNTWAGFQIDCDWTESNQNRYFDFLKAIKAAIGNLPLSATIRLHQIKFREKTGVPPIDRGMLMLYNAGEIQKMQRKNSIFEPDVVQPYLHRLNEYPLPLDYALPTFAWGMVYRLGNLVTILPERAADSVIALSHFKKLDQELFECLQSGFHNGFYFLKGDRLKVETIDPLRCKQAAELLLPYIKSDTFTIVFYQLGSPTYMRYDEEELEAIRHVFN